MFTGIIETVGLVQEIKEEGSNLTFTIKSDLASKLKIDQSLSHNGVCLTVIDQSNAAYKVTAIEETLKKSNLGNVSVGDKINLERCMEANGRFDGHIVQGHVDQVATCKEIKTRQGSWLFQFKFDPSFNNITVEKGSICINGVSLTCFDTKDDAFTVAIIPYTFENTNFQALRPGDIVNLEFDIVGKYIQKIMKARV